MELLVNALFALLAFFGVRWIGSMVAPEGKDSGKAITVIAIIVAIIVFVANFAKEVL